MFKALIIGKIKCVEIIVVMTWLSDSHLGPSSKDLSMEEIRMKRGALG